MTRHNSNHKGKADNCPTCDDEEELDKIQKTGKRLLGAKKPHTISVRRESFTTKLIQGL